MFSLSDEIIRRELNNQRNHPIIKSIYHNQSFLNSQRLILKPQMEDVPQTVKRTNSNENVLMPNNPLALSFSTNTFPNTIITSKKRKTSGRLSVLDRSQTKTNPVSVPLPISQSGRLRAKPQAYIQPSMIIPFNSLSILPTTVASSTSFISNSSLSNEANDYNDETHFNFSDNEKNQSDNENN